jgi:light-regulated signal transduction histidine kinase (bacteriophytochrome)
MWWVERNSRPAFRTGRERCECRQRSMAATPSDYWFATGVGLDPRTIEKLFDAFYTTKAHGLGIGLAVSRSIIETHNGTLWATANDGPGATFGFTIPCAPATESAAAARLG